MAFKFIINSLLLLPLLIVIIKGMEMPDWCIETTTLSQTTTETTDEPETCILNPFLLANKDVINQTMTDEFIEDLRNCITLNRDNGETDPAQNWTCEEIDCGMECVAAKIGFVIFISFTINLYSLIYILIISGHW